MQTAERPRRRNPIVSLLKWVGIIIVAILVLTFLAGVISGLAG